ncbi:similar to Saccharomyces cerevisiae YML069W POB3 Subunit of the heterodimeric FACT complex (Spt16p-Pob3p) [Maudiozyma barnettii]|uniref:FACT complex subunit POB3 n=1 Tax=Maudiozyma barnettii TaxID=61262 RepID=A0A8H2VKH4_9SACH|nr:FACT complex subunit POB3 [Kazachstania barnettii]CAB4257020.1 similar to Saccharomyces cerevisiae YML069W POB3 Subunit of the heterodimeric FACT complex (Spt16p-Pob3p) [Kazachstania barnettii]CAD1779391.1 similar to Saccharomyces cerevisiae YML069W POB3 Subunit of the heterodimeric FACT complex (Spt16p-Pob3p) [Kazachstania barnettii]
MSTDFDRIYLNQSKFNGRFRVADSGLGWKASTSGGSAANQAKAPFLLPATELSTIQWSRGSRGFELKINTKNSGVIQLDGFSQDDFNLIKSDFHRRFSIQVEHKEHSLRGWNWGKTDLARNEMVFALNGKPTFEIPYNHITNTNLTSKNEVGVEFNIQDENYQPAGDELVEMRFYIPGSIEYSGEDEDMLKKEDNGEDVKKEENEGDIANVAEEKSLAETFYEELKQKADISETAGDVIVSFPEVFLATPRGRYDIDMYNDFIRLRGKTYEYKLQYNQIQRIVSLPRADDIHHLIVLAVDPPLRQGQTTYPFLVLQFQKDEETEVQLNLDDKDYDENYKDKLKRQYDAKTHIVLSHVLKGLTDRRVIVPGGYKSKYEQCAVSCSYKANEGYLYPLDNAFFFLTKPTLYIPFSDVSSVNISRAGQTSTSSRTFDLEINLRLNKGSTTFGNISKEEQQLLENFLKSKNLKVKNEDKEAQQRLQTALGSDSEDEDINMGSAGEDDESVDEDFQVSSDGGDVAEEFDSDAAVSDASGSDGEDSDIGDSRPSKKAKTD